MTKIIHRHPIHTPPTAIRGEGVYVYDENNRQYLDACGGAAVSCLGYNHPAPIEAIRKQATELAYIHSEFFTSFTAESLAEKLADLAPAPLDHVVFLSGGSEAMETAFKLARQYFVETGETSRKFLISRRQSFHGNTFGALSIGSHVARRKPYLPMLNSDHHTIAPCFPYREQRENESTHEYGIRVANELEEKILELGADKVIGFVAETVGGATAGVLPPVPGYLKRIREICDQYGILLILDEVMCGSGRTGTFFSFTQDDIAPDMVILAKGLGAGYQPIAATIVSQTIYQAVHGGSGALMQSHTYMGHAIACAASLAVVNTIESENLLENVRIQGKNLIAKLRSELGSHSNVGDIRGRGLFIGIEFVSDKTSKEPLDPNFLFHSVLKRKAERNGLMCYTGGGSIDGVRGNHVMLAPAFIINDAIVDEIVEKMSQSIDDSMAEITAVAA